MIANLSDLLFQQIHAAETEAAKVYDPMVGVVVDNRDPMKLSRVKVSLQVLGGTETTYWAPISALGAGAERGWYFLPEIDDEVLVMFDHGDIQRPVVIGALWNGVDAPPDENEGANERRTIVSREGSRIEFDDEAGTITIEDGGGIGKITITTENKIIIESSSGDVCFHAPKGAINIVAKDVDIKGSMNCHLNSGSGGMNLTSGGESTFNGGQMLKIQGATTSFNAGSPPAAEKAKACCAEEPDPTGP